MAIAIGTESGYANAIMQMLHVTHGQDLRTPEEDFSSITYTIKIGKNKPRMIRWASGSQNYFGGIFVRDIAMMIQHEIDQDLKFASDALLALVSLLVVIF